MDGVSNPIETTFATVRLRTNVTRGHGSKRGDHEVWQDARSVAFGIVIPKALGDYLVLEALCQTHGCALSVTDDDLVAAAARALRTRGWLTESDQVVVLNTGSGLKYPQIALAASLPGASWKRPDPEPPPPT